MGDAAYILYGSSGDKLTRDPPADEDIWNADVQSFYSADSNRSYQRAAETLAVAIRRTWPAWNVVLGAAWTHEAMLNVLAGSADTIQQVHVFSHGASSGLSLAYKFPNHTSKRLNVHAAMYFADSAMYGDTAKVDRALAREDGLVAGRLSRYGREHLAKKPSFEARTAAGLSIAEARLAGIRGRLAKGAYYHLWNCYSGTAEADYLLGSSYAELTRVYRSQLQTKMTEQPGAGPAGQAKPGIAREIAKVFGVHCTCAKRINENSEAGTLFFHRDKKGDIQPQAGKEPSWMWIHPNSYWLTYGPDGENLTAARHEVLMFGRWRKESEVLAAAVSGNDPKAWKVKTPPPRWFTNAYDKGTLK